MTDTVTRAVPEPSLSSPVPRRTRKPGWLDLRLIAGVLLVLVAVIAGSLVLGSADNRSPVWAFAHDLAAGTTIKDSDLTAVQVSLGTAAGSYVAASRPVVGNSVQRGVIAGELVTGSDLVPPLSGVSVTIPIQSQNAPEISRGDRITVWVSTKTCRGVVVLSGSAVQEVRQAAGSFSSNNSLSIVVTLSAADAQRIVSALDLDSATLRVGALAAAQSPLAVGSLTPCATGIAP